MPGELISQVFDQGIANTKAHYEITFVCIMNRQPGWRERQGNTGLRPSGQTLQYNSTLSSIVPFIQVTSKKESSGLISTSIAGAVI